MLREIFIGRAPSHFQVNPVVRAFIISETFLWSCWNSFAPIFALFATRNIPGGNAAVAASSFSAHLIVRVIVELITGRYLLNKRESTKFWATIIGIMLLSVSYFGFAFTNTITQLFLFYGVAGLGLGIASPAKNSIFSSHLDKEKEAIEWATLDAVVFIGMALSATLGGFVAITYGFKILFLVISVVNLFGVIPYFLYLHGEKDSFFRALFHKIFPSSN